jgi:4-amino-4-deoxy-L-arabinose transferase-like glycosyltransferase
LATGFDDDEAYTLVVARRLALSYFDHPPLHQWLLHGFVTMFGEGHWDRIPFWALQVATDAPLYGLAARLFGREAALWTLFAFNASAYFLLSPDGSIMPDTPLLLALASAAWAIAEALYGGGSEGRKTALWVAAGVAFGLAGLAKYSAALAPLGLAGFFVASPRHRRWLWDWRPYAAGALALAVFSPALIWNARNGWISLAFQSGRAVAHVSLDTQALRAILEALGGQFVSLSPWVAVPLVAGLYRGFARGDRDSGEKYLLWLALPALLLFALLPLQGQRAIPHWFNSGWLFAFPLCGAWLAERGAGRTIWAKATVVLSAAMAALYAPAVGFGLAALLPAGVRDPTHYAYDWPSLARTASWQRNGAPAFVLVDDWRVGGRVGAALGPTIPICGFGADPRGFAFSCEPSRWLGKDALIVAAEGAAEGAAARTFTAAAPYFANLDAPETVEIGRGGRVERALQVVRAHDLVATYPPPYGRER